MRRALAAEWIKLRSVRSTYWTLAGVPAAVVIAALLALHASSLYDGASAEAKANAVVSPLETVAAMIAQLCLAVLGVRSITAEHATGMLRTTFTAMPRRGAVLAAKAVLIGATGLVAGLATLFPAYFLSRWIAGDRPLVFNESTLSQDLPSLLAGASLVALFALVGLGLGAVLRNAATALGAIFALWYVLPMIALNLPAPWGPRLGAVMLANLAFQLSGDPPYPGALMLSPWIAAAAMFLYGAAALTAAALALTRRAP
ncbi:ABC transporter permease [Bailinhaonella thermotolerans]|uniref:ABC transporter permease n=1 Tax=Bailinhaonella thermotolerans TaxID=1070861 RepID=A0A3A4AN87_9ACTN|nr:ABC transporter permease [Bailinhaonella thermotolerans]RJL29979.1 ABC transporter permease [Bailinhaonella thermotolerans]